MNADEQRTRQHRAALHRAASTRAARRRVAQVLAADPALRAQTSTAGDFAALREHRHAIELLAAAFARYAARPCLGVRAPGETRFTTVTYGEVWRRALAVAAALAGGGVRRGDFVGLYGPAGVGWAAADLACLYLGATSVPLQASLSPADLEHVVVESGLGVIASSARSAPGLDELRARRPGLRLASIDELAARGEALPAPPPSVPGQGGAPEQPLVTVSYTSGSTGRPKGVVYPDARWVQRMHEALANAPMPHVTVNYMSLAQIGGRLQLLVSLVSGGVTCFSPATDLSTLLDDVRLARPTTMLMIPRASGLVYQAFQRALLDAGGRLSGPGFLDTPEAQRVMAEMRPGFLGDRLCMVAVGAAPTAPEVIEFLERCFEISVVNAYGATELGTVATNGHVRADVEYKLVDVPELGYGVRDQPYPRGELWVKSPYVAPGYFKQPDAARPFADADGFVPSGDVVEERGPRELAWIDRRNNVIRMAQGEFVSVTRVEEALVTGGPLLAQAYVHGNPLRAYLLAVVVPNAESARAALARAGEDPASAAAMKRLLRVEIARIAAASGLRRHEVPRDFLVEPVPFSRDNGLHTESDKPRRPALRERYGPRLEALYAEIEARLLHGIEVLDAALPVDEKVRRAALAVLGLPDDETLDADVSFVGLGGDSVSAVRLAQVLGRACGRAPAVAAVLDPHLPLRALAARLAPTDGTPGFEAVHGAAPRFLGAADLRLDRFLPEAEAARALPLAGRPGTVLLTGASGFLGRALLVELLQRLGGGRVVCVVRAEDDAAARARLLAQLGPAGTPLRDAVDREARRLDVIAGDLTLPRLGLAVATHERLATEVDLVVHNGALVNHALAYRALFEPNVLGTVEAMRLAIARRRKPVVFVSSVGVTAGLRRDAPAREDEPAARLHPRWPLPPEGAEDGYGLGYSASKWAGEVLLGELARATEVPVAIFRCGLLFPHRRYPGLVNEGDALSRLLFGLARAGVAPPSFYAPGAAGHADGLPVDQVAAAIAAVAGEGLQRSVTYHAVGDRSTPAVSLDRIVDWIASAGAALERSASYDAWRAAFRERLERLDEAARRRSPLLILHRWSAPLDAASAPRVDDAAFRALVRERLPDDGGFVLDEVYVHRWLRDLGALPERA